MKLDWLGRYRELVEALILHLNVYTKELTTKIHICDEIYLTSQEWQVLEYIVEHEQDDDSMRQVSDRLAIPQSSFSKHIKLLCEYGLVDKYQLVGNRKNIILKPSEKGKMIYHEFAQMIACEMYREFFHALETCSDEDIQAFTKALLALSNGNQKTKKQELVKL